MSSVEVDRVDARLTLSGANAAFFSSPFRGPLEVGEGGPRGRERTLRGSVPPFILSCSSLMN